MACLATRIGHGPAGDLFLQLRLAKYPDYRVGGNELYLDLDPAPWKRWQSQALGIVV